MGMKRPLLLLALAFSIGLFPCLQAAPEKPNIVVILVDDMGWSNIGCYGGYVETPNLDRMAAEGLRFSQFYNAARCCPTRASIMTGLHPHQAGIGHMTVPTRTVTNPETGETSHKPIFAKEDRAHIPYEYQGWIGEHIPTVPEMLKPAGYSTYMVGKWHLAAQEMDTWPIQRGFGRFYGHLAGTSDYFYPKDLYLDNELVDRGNDRFYITDAITEKAVEFLSDHDSAKDEDPFFLYLAYNAPHFPMHCMPEDYEKYRGRFKAGWDVLRNEKLERQKKMGIVPENTTLAPLPGAGTKDGNRGPAVPRWDSLTPEQQDHMDAIMATYAGIVDRIDQNIGKLLAHLQTAGETDNTLIFFLSDNGGEAESPPLGAFNFERLGKYGDGWFKDPERGIDGRPSKYGKAWATLSNTPFREYKHFTFQGGIQTPLVVHWPNGIKNELKGSIIEQYGYLPDLVETCLSVAGAARPETYQGKDVPRGEGKSLADLFQGVTAPLHEEPICIEHEGNRVVRHGQWKLVAYYDEPWELYDIDHDRSESQDLAAANPEVVKRLSQAYDDFAQRAGVVGWDIAQEYSVYKQKNAKK